MGDDARRASGSAHRVDIDARGVSARASLHGVEIARSERALVLRETGLAPVVYFPRADVREGALLASARSSRCPFKGTASYWSVVAGDRTEADAAWSYETPIDAVAAIAGHVAFYVDRIDVEADVADAAPR